MYCTTRTSRNNRSHLKDAQAITLTTQLLPLDKTVTMKICLLGSPRCIMYCTTRTSRNNRSHLKDAQAITLTTQLLPLDKTVTMKICLLGSRYFGAWKNYMYQVLSLDKQQTCHRLQWFNDHHQESYPQLHQFHKDSFSSPKKSLKPTSYKNGFLLRSIQIM